MVTWKSSCVSSKAVYFVKSTMAFASTPLVPLLPSRTTAIVPSLHAMSLVPASASVVTVHEVPSVPLLPFWPFVPLVPFWPLAPPVIFTVLPSGQLMVAVPSPLSFTEQGCPSLPFVPEQADNAKTSPRTAPLTSSRLIMDCLGRVP